MSNLLQNISPHVWRLLKPPPEISSWDWLCQYGRAHDGSRFDPDHVPWVRGVCEAFDDPRFTEINLQWAARTYKTSVCHSLLLCAAATQPCAMLLGGPTEKLVRRHVRFRLYPAAEKIEPLRALLPAENRRGQLSVDFGVCSIQTAWSGSETALADRSARITHAAEMDKWDRGPSEGGEGDPVEQFEKRSHEFADRKNLGESTPQQRGRSRIEARRLAGTDSRLWVPCPHCGGWQVLRRGSGAGAGDRDRGGLVWQKDGDRHDPDLAYATARYLCACCGEAILDADKPAMVRAGRWAAAGQRWECGDDGQPVLVGTPLRPHTRNWSSQLAAYYSLDVRWGQFAEWWVRAYRHPARRRTYVQLVDGETFEVLSLVTDESSLARRLCVPGLPRGRVPSWARLLILACDVQHETLPWSLVAIGPNLRTHLVDWGRANDWGQLAGLIERTYAVDAGAGGGGAGSMRVHLAVLDSGYRTKQVYDFVASMNRRKKRDRQAALVLCCKGTAKELAGNAWKIVTLGVDTRARRRAAKLSIGTRLLRVQVGHWEELVQSALCEDLSGKPGELTLAAEAAGDAGLLKDLINATYDDDAERWVKRDVEHANDWRDTIKYAFCAADVWLQKHRGRLPAAAGDQAEASAKSKGSAAAGGRASKKHARRERRPGLFSGPFQPRPGGRWV